MNYTLAIFDMDGTILDTLDDLADSLNHALCAAGYAPLTPARVRALVGNGARRLVASAVPAGTDAAATAAVYGAFTAYYQAHCAHKTRPYAGITALLGALRRAGCQTAVVSNKGDGAVQALCARYFDGLFDAVVGERPGMEKKPAPDAVHTVLRQLAVPRARAVYIGDSEVDVATARNAGVDGVFVDWGFRDRAALLDAGARVVVSRPEALWALLLGD